MPQGNMSNTQFKFMKKCVSDNSSGKGRVQRVILLTMKLLFILVFAGTMAVSASVYSQKTKIDLQLRNTTVGTILKSIESNSEFIFIYDTELVNTRIEKSISIRDADIESVLNELFGSSNIAYLVDDRQVFLYKKDDLQELERLKTDVKVEQPQPQKKELRGKVTDSKGGPIPGTTVLVKGTTVGTITNSDGTFTLSVPEESKVLTVSFVGFKTQDIPIGNKLNFLVALEEETFGIDEVVAVGYGTMKKSDLTGSVVSVKSDEIVKMPSTRIDVALQGKVPGVVISNDKGQPGQDPVIRIRGGNSIVGNNDPLIVVDGLLGAQLSSINPNEIATVDVLKDASATAIYGSRGANGVIIITTKRGISGETRFDFNSYVGFAEPTRIMEMMSAQEQIDFLKQVPSTHTNYRLYQDFLALYDPASVDIDWQDVIFRTGMTQNYFLSASGGNDRTKFSISGSVLSQDGIIEASGYDRQTFRANFDHKASDKLKFGFNLNMSRTVQNNSRVDQPEGSWGKSITATAMAFSPAIPIYDAEGNYSQAYPPGEAIDNPVALLREQINENTGFSMHLNTFAEYEILRGLSFRTSYNYQFGNSVTNSWTGKALKAASGIGSASVSSHNSNSWLTDNILTFDREFGIHKLTVMGGFSASGYNSPNLYASGNTYPTESLKYYAIELADPSTFSIGSGFTENTLASYLGRVNYVLSGKYLFTAEILSSYIFLKSLSPNKYHDFRRYS